MEGTHNPCDFTAMRETFTNNYTRTTLTVLEAQMHGSCIPTQSCLGAFLTAARKYTYLHCTDNDDDFAAKVVFPEMNYPLGAPRSDAVETAPGSQIWTRTFASGTVSTWNNNTKVGTVDWAHLRK
jgi:hypothetical protein